MMHDCTKDLVYDQQIEIDSLREKVAVLEREKMKLKFELGQAKTDARLMKAKLKNADMVVRPTCVDEYEYECPECGFSLRLDEDYYCGGCGSCLDWDDVEYPEDGGNWYAEEGERFLQAEVYEPLRRELMDR